MTARHELEALFLANLPFVEKAIGYLARGLPRADAEDFGSWAKERLIEDDYGVLRKFRGESTLPTYLSMVLSRLLNEYRVSQWGRWRPTVAARRLGPVAMRLEVLVRRDGMPAAQAIQVLRTSGETDLSDRELLGILTQLPERAPLRPVQGGVPAPDVAAESRADDRVEVAEVRRERDVLQRALDSVMEALPNQDRLIVRMHCMEDMSIADIARGLNLPQKPLYERVKRALKRLRTGLENSGISRDFVRSIGEQPPW